MISHPAFPAEPWAVREKGIDLNVLSQTESVFALSNGHIGLRGNLDEGEPHGLPGTYLNSVYEDRPLPYGETGYGYPQSSQTMINVTNGKLIRLLVEDEPFDVRYGELRAHEQVVKQADLVLALYKRGDAFTPEQKARDFAYYEALTVRDSSLSASSQAVIAAEVGQLNLAYDYLGEAARMDLDNLERNTGAGLHIASLAGAWIALVGGFGGMGDSGGSLTFAPRLPSALTRLTFAVLYRGCRLRVDIGRTEATYTLTDGKRVELAHHGQTFVLTAEQPVTRPIPPIEPGPRPQQPPGRAPLPRAGI